MSITQKDLAKESGVSLGTIMNTENGDNVSLNNLISILRVIRVVDNLDSLIPQKKSNPMDILDLGHNRKRVSKSNKNNDSDWKWGDEK